MEVISKLIPTSNGRFIKVYDNLFTFAERKLFDEFMLRSSYKAYGTDAVSVTSYDSAYTEQLFSNFCVQDVMNMGLFSTKGYRILDEEYKLSSRQVNQYRVNLSTPFEKNLIHIDNCSLTLLYYANMDWRLEFSGHTIFMDDNLDEPLYT